MRSFFSKKFFNYLRSRFSSLWSRPLAHILWWAVIVALCLLLYHAPALKLYAEFHLPVYPWLEQIPGLFFFCLAAGLLFLFTREFHRFQSEIVHRQLTDEGPVIEAKDSPRLLDRIPKEG